MSSVPYGTSASWSWPTEEPTEQPTKEEKHNENIFMEPENLPGAFEDADWEEVLPAETPEEETEQETPRPRRHYPPRTCRICLEVVQPNFESFNSTSRFSPAPKVSYISADPADGRLIRPCKCKGSSAYVHEGCLQSWRHADPSYGRRNYWECPTCKFKYQLARLQWSSWMKITVIQIVMTISILLGTIFVLGFIADPILNLYLDPYDTITSLPTRGVREIHYDDEDGGWSEHFLKGLASLGLLGMVKAFFMMPPWQWWNIRHSGVLGGSNRGRRGGTGRDRLENISWTIVLVGVVTFMVATWKFVRNWSRRTMEKASDRVVNVQGEDDDEEEEQPSSTDENIPVPEQESFSTGTDIPGRSE